MIKQIRIAFMSGFLGAMILIPSLGIADQPYQNQGKEQPSTMPSQQSMEKINLNVGGIKTEADASKIKKELEQKPGIVLANCDQKVGTCRVEFNSTQIKKEDVIATISRLGFNA